MFTIRRCISGGYKIVDYDLGVTKGISAKRAQNLLKTGKARLGRTYKGRSKKAASPF